MTEPQDSGAPAPPGPPRPASQPRAGTWGLTLGALGVVFGDIGTDPLFSLRECFAGAAPDAIPPAEVYGVLSLILWALIAVVCVKYLAILFRADNQGEGGILAMLALNQPWLTAAKRARAGSWAIALGLFGAGMLYADAAVTPAISVLSAVEGLNDLAPALRPAVVPLTVVILVALFLFQPRGTGRVGAWFGPVMVAWFAAIGALGIPAVWARPEVLLAVNPLYAASFLHHAGMRGLLAIGGVVLTIAGVEAFYADMGHFGKGPIRLAWFALVMPALVLNYFGQGALLLRSGSAALQSPFYGLVHPALLAPLILLATGATVIASQSLISGAFSLTEHAIRLGYLPPLRIVHTSSLVQGQIYVPWINWMLMALSVGLVLATRDPARLGGMYGMAVIGAMVPVSVHFYFSARQHLKWGRPAAFGVTGLFLAADAAMLLGSLPRIAQGAWLPLVLGGAILAVMLAWSQGMEALRRSASGAAQALGDFVREAAGASRVPGAGVFFSSREGTAPHALVSLLTLKRSLPGTVVVLDAVREAVPRVAAQEAVELRHLGSGVYAVRVRLGYLERLDAPDVVRMCARRGVPIDEAACTYWLSRDEIVRGGTLDLTGWKFRLFALLRRATPAAGEDFGLPRERTIEIGVETDLSEAGGGRLRRF